MMLAFTCNGRPATRQQIRKHVSSVRLINGGQICMEVCGSVLLHLERFHYPDAASRRSYGKVAVGDMPLVPWLVEVSCHGQRIDCAVLA